MSEGVAKQGGGPALALWSILLGCSALGLIITTAQLTIGPFPSAPILFTVYFIYSVCALAFFHALFFLANLLSLRIRGYTLSSRYPKYLEYVYAALISVGVLQVLVMAPQFSDYITFRRGDDAALYDQIAKQAQTDVAERCPKGGEYFTKHYCDKLRRIVEAQNPQDYIHSAVLRDHEFLTHAVGVSYVVSQSGPQAIKEVSPIFHHADALRARREYGAMTPSRGGRALAWIGALLLPLGISLRVVKTSLELFGKLS